MKFSKKNRKVKRVGKKYRLDLESLNDRVEKRQRLDDYKRMIVSTYQDIRGQALPRFRAFGKSCEEHLQSFRSAMGPMMRTGRERAGHLLQRLNTYSPKPSKNRMLEVAATAFLVGLGCLDWFMPDVYAIHFLYLLPLAMTPWMPSRHAPVYIAAAGVTLSLGGLVFSAPPQHVPLAVAVLNRGIGIGVLLMGAFLLIRQKTQEARVHDLQTQIDRVRQRLEQSQPQMSRLFQSMPLAAALIDLRGNILDVNEAFINLLGYAREDFGDRISNLVDFSMPESRPWDLQAFEDLQRKGKYGPFEKACLHKKGISVPFTVETFMLGKDMTGKDQAVYILHPHWEVSWNATEALANGSASEHHSGFPGNASS